MTQTGMLLLLLLMNVSHIEKISEMRLSAPEEMRSTGAGQSPAHSMDFHVENYIITEGADYLKP